MDLNELEASLTGNTALVTMMYANNETGTIFPIEEILFCMLLEISFILYQTCTIS